MIFYESPHRLLKFLEELIEYFGAERQASISRELTKMFEENVRGTLAEIKTHFEENILKGEFVIVVAGNTEPAPKKDDKYYKK
jgi:16S rRNA (cytidine1402-2'-O)-methyltransferase